MSIEIDPVVDEEADLKGVQMNTYESSEWMTSFAKRFPTHQSVERFHTLLKKIAEASTYDPGETDLDDEQPVRLMIDLGDVRMARRLLR